MSFFDDPPRDPEGASGPPANEAPGDPTTLAPAAFEAQRPGMGGESGAAIPAPDPIPADLQITWSWAHFLIFGIFAFISFIFVDFVILMLNAPPAKLPAKELEQYYMSKPMVPIGIMLGWYAAIFLFLFVTLSVLEGHSFWKSLGWRKLVKRAGEMSIHPALYFVAGCGLSLFVAIASAQVEKPEHLPIEEMFKQRRAAFMFLAMAVIVAPMVEETLFRGYLYPSLARFGAFILRRAGLEESVALRWGVGASIAVTGMLFGLMHGMQLGWTWGLVSMLVLVGVVLTIVRARTGSVFASYMMHLGYNSFIAIFAILGTHGFTKLPGQ